MEIMTAEEFILLKTKVKNEMLRRKYYGSLESLSSSTYDFVTVPVTNQKVLEEQGKKVIDLLLNICDKDNIRKNTIKGDNIPEGALAPGYLMSWVDALAAESLTDNKSSCRGACTGLCFGACSSTCAGCSSGCSSCTNCSGKCDTSCSGCVGCSTGCNAGCNGCTATCGSGCASGAKTG